MLIAVLRITTFSKAVAYNSVTKLSVKKFTADKIVPQKKSISSIKDAIKSVLFHLSASMEAVSSSVLKVSLCMIKHVFKHVLSIIFPTRAVLKHVLTNILLMHRHYSAKSIE